MGEGLFKNAGKQKNILMAIATHNNCIVSLVKWKFKETLSVCDSHGRALNLAVF